jgi:DNA-binding transcriptional ArsR family regulator
MTAARSTQPPIYGLKAEFFTALGHPTRIRLLQLLRDGERTVGALQTALELDSGSTSQQLAALRKQGLVESRREGTNVYYDQQPSAREVDARSLACSRHQPCVSGPTASLRRRATGERIGGRTVRP